MELIDYRKMRTGIQLNAAPAAVRDVEPLAQGLHDGLVAAGLFTDVEVEATDNVDALVVAMCTFPAEMGAGRLADWLEELWEHQLRYPWWEAHAILVDDDQVEFLGATRVSGSGHYVTVHLIAQRAAVPAQRPSAE